MAVLLLTKSDLRRYATLISDVENQYMRGTDDYPQTFISTYNMLANFRNPNATMQLQTQEACMAFAQDDDDDPPYNKPSRNTSSGCDSHGGCSQDGASGYGGHGQGKGQSRQ